MDFYHRLNYSLGNEDWHVEEKALRIQPGDSAVCVTASGDRPLHLLMTNCADILSIDMNHIQNYLLNLKLAAIAQLDYETYLAFLGCTPTPHRLSIFENLKSSLNPDAARYWQDHKKLISDGIIYKGKVERLTCLSSKVLNVLRHKKIKTLLSFNDIDEQRLYLTKTWDTYFWRKLFEVLINPNLSRYLLRDPGLNSYTEYSNNPGQYIYQRMQRYLNNNLAKKSPLLQLVLTGKILPDAYFPYLTYDGYKKIRRDMSRLRYETTNIIEFLNSQDITHFDCFSLSDIASYMPQKVFEKLLSGVYHSAKPNARFCIREFMSKRYIADHLKGNFKRDTQLEQQLELEETNFVYRFMVGGIVK